MPEFRWLGRVDYREAWELQRTIHAEVVAGDAPDTVLLLEHPPVYTAGRRTQPEHRPNDGTPVVDVDRGGLITWHGPGQLVGYPIVKLPEDVGVVDYIRRVEEALIRYLADTGIATGRVAGRAGVWLPSDARGPERKIAQIGVRVAHKTSMHGFALNVDPDLTWFDRIVPCGISDAGVTSMARELEAADGVRQVADAITPHLAELLSWQPFERTPDIERAPEGISYGLTV
ncbi:lipoyl(octanoyl) transferase LipB [Naumannella sp. ID2617S]|nr:lipoyl(octanoyl) transferase LipB [Naumannella sp. ID2617S]